MSDATTPADPTDQIATTPAVLSPETPIVPTSGTKRVPDDSEAAVVQDAQQYDWREDLDALNADAGLVGKHSTQFHAIRITVYIERLEAERDAAVDFREDFDCRQLKAERDVLLAEHEAFVSDHRCGIDGLQGCDYCAAHDNAERVIRG